MRIISGKFKGRRFNPPLKKCRTRPTMDMAKEGLFNILSNHYIFENISVLDLFAGTGSMSLEFISRGCNKVSYVDNFRTCLHFINDVKNILPIQSELNITKSDVFQYLEKNNAKFDIIFADPPYDFKYYDKLINTIIENQFLQPKGTLILEHNKLHDFSDHPNFENIRKYGTNIFSFFISL